MIENEWQGVSLRFLHNCSNLGGRAKRPVLINVGGLHIITDGVLHFQN